MNTNKKELVSAYTHLFGAILSIFGLVALIIKAKSDNIVNIIGVVVFGISMIMLYSMSFTYHIIDDSLIDVKLVLRKLDHIMIFILIAGTYTPICLICFNGMLVGKVMMFIVWSIVVIGLFIKIFWINAPRWISTALYISMGWVVIFIMKDVIKHMNPRGILWLFFGGVVYTLGAVIYGLKKPNFKCKNFGFHELFHVFILLGTVCHYIMVYCYIL